MGRKFDPKLNIGRRPIANKYREGKMQRTLKRELNQCLKLLKGKGLESARFPVESARCWLSLVACELSDRVATGYYWAAFDWCTLTGSEST